MRYFYIDLENVRNEGFEGVLSLGEDDFIFVFYSDNALNLSIPTLENINNSKASVKYIKTNYIGKNAMDFQIVSLFGAMIERNREGGFYIISHDNGFKSAVSFCESYFSDYQIRCNVCPTIISAITADMKIGSSRKSAKTQATSVQKATASKDKETSGRKETASKDSKASGSKESASKDSKASDRKETASNESGASGRKEVALKDSKASGRKEVASNDGGVLGRKENAYKDNEVSGHREAVAGKENVKSRRGRNANERAEDAAFAENSVTETGTSGKKQYIYDCLKELLSEKTIDIYAETIHEGLLSSSNRDELRMFFKSRYGEGEGEALYRVTQSDFEALKKQSGKVEQRAAAEKKSRRRHQAKAESMNTDGNVNTDKNVNADCNVNPDGNVNTDKNVNADKSVNTDGSVNADKNVNVDANMNADANINADANVNTYTGGQQSEATGKAGTVGKAGTGKPDAGAFSNESDSSETKRRPRRRRRGGNAKQDSRFDTESEAKLDSRFDTESEVRSDSRLDTESEVRSDSRFDTESEARSDSRFDTESEVRSGAVIRKSAKNNTQSEKSKRKKAFSGNGKEQDSTDGIVDPADYSELTEESNVSDEASEENSGAVTESGKTASGQKKHYRRRYRPHRKTNKEA